MADGNFARIPDDAGVFFRAGNGVSAGDGPRGRFRPADGVEENGKFLLEEREVELIVIKTESEDRLKR